MLLLVEQTGKIIAERAKAAHLKNFPKAIAMVLKAGKSEGDELR